jgi:hypothetical protein
MNTWTHTHDITISLSFQIKYDFISAVCTDGRDEKYIQYLVGKPEGKRPLGRPKRRWEDNIRIDLSEIRWEGVE